MSSPKSVWVIKPCLPKRRIKESPPTKGGVTKWIKGINENNLENGMFARSIAYA